MSDQLQDLDMRVVEIAFGVACLIGGSLWTLFWSHWALLTLGWIGGWLAGDGMSAEQWALTAGAESVGLFALFLGVSFTFAVGPLAKPRE